VHYRETVAQGKIILKRIAQKYVVRVQDTGQSMDFEITVMDLPSQYIQLLKLARFRFELGIQRRRKKRYRTIIRSGR
jgi:hypothetical protein